MSFLDLVSWGWTFLFVTPLTSTNSLFWQESRILGLRSWADPSLPSPFPRAWKRRLGHGADSRATSGTVEDPDQGVTREHHSQHILLELAERGAFSLPGC